MDPAHAWLIEPVTDENPCGEDLEDTQLLASFDGYRVFGQMSSVAGETDWRELRDAAAAALRQSKDFRLLANYAVAQLQTEGFAPFCSALEVVAHWLEAFPEHVYPRVDEDAILRRNSLNNFADRMAVLDAVRRTPFVRHPAVGAFSLRDVEIASGNLKLAEGEEGATEAQIKGALSAIDQEQLDASASALELGVEALGKIDRLMRDAHGYEGAPDLAPLLAPLKQIHGMLAEQVAARAALAAAAAGAGDDAAGDAGGQPGVGAVIGVGSIRSRDDAARALEAVAEFFRKNEPSSPVPIVVERAKRLISLNFLEVLADMAPDGLDEAKRIGGIRDE